MRNLLKMLTGVLTPFGKCVALAVACLITVVAVAASIECPLVVPIAAAALFLLLCWRKIENDPIRQKRRRK
jgi:hypothetical protein